ncbi:DUF6221 family protein [Streptomyces sp. NPDC101175]|uniref:DUF6221 family protein n=1 Tax=Streptomyces sp. NPDC101175 TaxID=3366123 RepID=UPI0038368AD3
MTDLHGWITQQVDVVEAAIRAGIEGRRVAFKPGDGGPVITGAVTEVKQTPDGPQLVIAQYDVEPVGEDITDVQPALAALRRCEADRRILARHRLAPSQTEDPMRATACEGCGEWGKFEYPVSENLNDCPELLDLAHAHGITAEILAGLDRPQAPELKPRGYVDRRPLPFLTRPITSSDVPEALRGPRWKP